MKIRTRLLCGFLVFAVIVPITGYIGVYGSQKISRSFSVTADSSTPSIQALLEIKSAANEIEAQVVGFELFNEFYPFEVSPAREEGSLVGDQKYALIASVEKIERWLDQYQRHVIPGQERNKRRVIQDIKEEQQDVINAAFDTLELKEKGMSGPTLVEQKNALKEAQRNLRETIGTAISNELDDIRQRNDAADSTSETIIKVIVGVSGVTLIIVIAVGYWLSRSISNPIKSLTELVGKLGVGSAETVDTLKITSKDEIGQLSRAFQDMTTRLKVTTVSRDELAEEVALRQVLAAAD